jgi:hypothetical protein
VNEHARREADLAAERSAVVDEHRLEMILTAAVVG